MEDDPRSFALESRPGCRSRATGLPDLESCAAACAALREHEASHGGEWPVATPEGEVLWGLIERRDRGGGEDDAHRGAPVVRRVAAGDHPTLSALCPPNWPLRPSCAEGSTDTPERGDAGEGAA